jgi:hypothetical protein
MNRTKTFWAGIFGAFIFIMSSVIGGFLIEDYSHIKQFISESYAIDTTYGFYLRIFGYIPSGILITFFAFSAIRLVPKHTLTTLGLMGVGLFYGIGTIIVSFFPCDSGCNKEFINPSISQFIHNVTGALTYLIVPVSLILIGIGSKKWNNSRKLSIISISSGIIALVFVMQLTNENSENYIGLFQRIIEGSILFWLINFAFFIKNYKNT